MSFERIGSETAWEGRIAKVRVDRFRYDDGGWKYIHIEGEPYEEEGILHIKMRRPRPATGAA